MYNYLEAMRDDIKEYCNENNINLKTCDIDKLYDDLWVEDSVTGNASGSYTFNSELAREYVLDNFNLLKEALYEFGELNERVDIIFEDKWEYADVTIRCYLLMQAITDAIENM